MARLGGWNGARVANDQVWAKPPGAAPITFHRDSTYFDFTPPDVITVWIALDDMTEELGTLEYITKSHLWGDERRGSASQFFDSRDNRTLVNDAARQVRRDTVGRTTRLPQSQHKNHDIRAHSLHLNDAKPTMRLNSQGQLSTC